MANPNPITEKNPRGAGRKKKVLDKNVVTKHFRIEMSLTEARKLERIASRNGRTPTQQTRLMLLDSLSKLDVNATPTLD